MQVSISYDPKLLPMFKFLLKTNSQTDRLNTHSLWSLTPWAHLTGFFFTVARILHKPMNGSQQWKILKWETFQLKNNCTSDFHLCFFLLLNLILLIVMKTFMHIKFPQYHYCHCCAILNQVIILSQKQLHFVIKFGVTIQIPNKVSSNPLPSLSFWIGSLISSSWWVWWSFLARFSSVSLLHGRNAARWL